MLSDKNIAVFDLEIQKRIDQCSRGWSSHDEMGISVLCLFDYREQRYRVFDGNNAAEAIKILHTYDLVVGFNIVNFDWKVIKASWADLCKSAVPRTSRDYDILREIWIAKGLNPDVFRPETHGGYKLDDVAFDTIGLRKSGDGALAPVLFQEGRLSELYDYCIRDVQIEKELFEFVAKHGYVIRGGRQINLAFPEI